MATVELERISKFFGKTQVVRDLSLAIQDKEFLVFVGPSGCGKSTLLRMIAGLEEISGGKLRIGGSEMNDVAAADRGIAMVFQSYALYPHMSVRENIGFGLKMAGQAASEVKAKVDDAARMLQIENLMERRPRELSGGQRQRVAIGRAIVKEPKVFLFDEPLSNLDADLRGQMRVEIAKLHKSMDSTVIYVTHDQVEAMTLADRIVVMRDGIIEQVGTPEELYAKPSNTFVAQFLGQPKMNLLRGTIGSPSREPQIVLGSDTAVRAGPLESTPAQGEPVTLGIRPNDLKIAEAGNENAFSGTIEIVEHLGSEDLVHVRLNGSGDTITAVAPKRSSLATGNDINLAFNATDALVFDADGIRR